MSSHSSLFTKTNSSRVIYESIKTLEIKTFVLLNLSFASTTILSCFFFLFLIIDALIPAVITQIFNPSAELAIPIGVLINDAKTEIETPLYTGQYNSKLDKPFYASY